MEAIRLDVPVLPNGFRLHWDKVRERYVIVFPEGAVALNPTAVEVIELCDGKRTIEEIAAELSARHQGADVLADVENLLLALANRGLITDASASA